MPPPSMCIDEDGQVALHFPLCKPPFVNIRYNKPTQQTPQTFTPSLLQPDHATLVRKAARCFAVRQKVERLFVSFPLESLLKVVTCTSLQQNDVILVS